MDLVNYLISILISLLLGLVGFVVAYKQVSRGTNLAPLDRYWKSEGLRLPRAAAAVR